MCKILCFTDSRDMRKTLAETITSVWSHMATTEKDGYGAAWIDPEGIHATARCSVPVFPSGLALPSFVKGFASRSAKGRNPKTKAGSPVIVHGRTATCGVELGNTHPMQAQGYTLVHNGVVSSATLQNKLTSCDSELLAIALAQGKGTMAKIEELISGYYAFMALTPEGRLIVARDGIASLHVGRARYGYVIATTELLVRAQGASYVGPFEAKTVVTFKDGRFAALPFVPSERLVSSEMSKLATKALGNSYGGKGYFGSEEDPRYVLRPLAVVRPKESTATATPMQPKEHTNASSLQATLALVDADRRDEDELAEEDREDRAAWRAELEDRAAWRAELEQEREAISFQIQELDEAKDEEGTL